MPAASVKNASLCLANAFGDVNKSRTPTPNLYKPPAT
jgi:hypothetical protein